MELNIVVVRNLGDLANANVYAYKFRVQLINPLKRLVLLKPRKESVFA